MIYCTLLQYNAQSSSPACRQTHAAFFLPGRMRARRIWRRRRRLPLVPQGGEALRLRHPLEALKLIITILVVIILIMKIIAIIIILLIMITKSATTRRDDTLSKLGVHQSINIDACMPVIANVLGQSAYGHDKKTWVLFELGLEPQAL